MKIAITGHSSGIGQEIYNIIDLTMPDAEIRGYSKSNGWNLASNEGADVLGDILDWDPDIVFNNAYYPKIQNKILITLYSKWAEKEEEKVIINTGSIAGYMADYVGKDNDYVKDKAGLTNFCVLNSFNYKFNNKCRIHNVSLGFVNTPLLTRTVYQPNLENLINVEDAAFMMIDLMEWDKPYMMPEIVISPIHVNDKSKMDDYFQIANKNMMKHVARSNRKLENSTKSST